MSTHAPTHDPRPALGARAQQLSRYYGEDAPVTVAARQDLAEAQIEAAVQKVVAAAPPLRREQADRLAGLIARSAGAR